MSVSYGWLAPAGGPGKRVGLVVQAAYHLEEFVPLRDELRARGIPADLLVPLPPRKPLNRFRPGVRRFGELLAAAPLPLVAASTAEELGPELSSVVVMNDWGQPKSLVDAVRAAGRPAYAWIEGVQDFADVDTGQARGAYTHVDHVFCLGEYGAARLVGTSRSIVGSARLRELWAGPGARPTGRRATVNSNFTYGVLTEHRRSWVASAAAACRSASMPWVLSRHSAERGLAFPHRTSRLPIGDLLDDSTHFVGRFSTVCYEALVRGVEFVYHNPHGEREPTFAQSQGAFVTTATTGELAAALSGPVQSADETRASAQSFLSHHLRLDPGPAPAVLAADVIESALRG